MTGCPMRRAVSPEVSDAVAVCPFLHAVKDFQGEEYAIRLAVNPFASASNPASQPIFPEDAAASVQAVFNLFHGSKGAIPLQGNKAEVAPSPAVLKPPTDSSDALLAHVPATAPPSGCPHHSMPLPMASISISGFKFLVSS